MALIKAAVDRHAKARRPGECRLLGTRRFDVLLGWARRTLGLDPPEERSSDADADAEACCDACGRSGPGLLPVNVTVPLTTLLRMSEQPGELDGMPIPADVARELAADGRWRRWVVEPDSGALLDIGSATYRPGAALDRFVRGRDRTCRFPSCTQPSVRCDLDHMVAFHTAAGTTVPGNLIALCRHHHRLKHETDWSYRTDANGDVVWTAASGRRYVDRADDHYDDPVLSHAHTRQCTRQHEDPVGKHGTVGNNTTVRNPGVHEQPVDPWLQPPQHSDQPPPF